MKKISLMLFCFLFLQGFVYAQEGSDIVATVNGKNITKTYVSNILKQDFENLMAGFMHNGVIVASKL